MSLFQAPWPWPCNSGVSLVLWAVGSVGLLRNGICQRREGENPGDYSAGNLGIQASLDEIDTLWPYGHPHHLHMGVLILPDFGEGRLQRPGRNHFQALVIGVVPSFLVLSPLMIR